LEYYSSNKYKYTGNKTPRTWVKRKSIRKHINAAVTLPDMIRGGNVVTLLERDVQDLVPDLL
jgi:hypothetical protein